MHHLNVSLVRQPLRRLLSCPPDPELLPPNPRTLLHQRCDDDEGEEEERADPGEPGEGLEGIIDATELRRGERS